MQLPALPAWPLGIAAALAMTAPLIAIVNAIGVPTQTGCRIGMAARTGRLNGGMSRNGNPMQLCLFGGLALGTALSGLLWLTVAPAPGGEASAFYHLEFYLVPAVAGLVVLHGYRRGVRWSVD